MSKKVCIIFGWAEGEGHGRKLRQSLHRAGFVVTKDAKVADVLVVHSGGIFLIPNKPHAQLILIVGMPYQPGKHPRKSLKEKIGRELRTPGNRKFLIRKTALNFLYFASKPRHHYKIWRAWKKDDLPDTTSSLSVIIRNRHDVFSDHLATTEFASAKDWDMLSLPGGHDDLWLHPEEYVRIIRTQLKAD